MEYDLRQDSMCVLLSSLVTSSYITDARTPSYSSIIPTVVDIGTTARCGAMR